MMSTPAWAPGTLYAPGALVVPRTAPATTWPALSNGDFESGDFTDWDTITSDPYLMLTVSNFRPFAGVYGSFYRGINGGSGVGGGSQVVYLHQTKGPVRAGQSVTLSAYIAQDDTNNSQNYGAVRIYWFKADDSPCSPPYSEASRWVAGNYNNYEFNTVTAQAPAEAAYARAGVWQNANNQGGIRSDNVTWTSVIPPMTAGLLYRAVQPTIGTSDNAEPVWPPTLGLTVVDNTVTWEAVLMSRVVWEARPILRSGSTEPEWPEVVGAAVSDNTISWVTATRQVEQAPNSKVVAITASKVFAADEDIIRYSATVNPLDWTSADNAGYLPSGLNQNGSNDTAVLNIYRGNLVGFSSSTFQNWQVDEDPANMELLDVMEGIGSTWQHAAQPVAKDLFYLAALGVRTVGIAGGSVNLVNGDAGMPIDPLVRAAIRVADANTIKPIGMYYPSLGQYMLAFGNYPPGELSISGDLELVAVNQPLPPFSYTASGGVRPYAFSLRSGTSMPPGLTLNEDGSVAGTPTETGLFAWEVQVVDALGNIAWKPDAAEIVLGPSISGEAPDGLQGEPYSFTYTTAAGAAPIDRTVLLDPLPTDWLWDEATATISHAGNVLWAVSIALRIRVYDTLGLYADHNDTFAISAPEWLGIANSDVVAVRPLLGSFTWMWDEDENVTAVGFPSIKGAVRYGSSMFAVVHITSGQDSFLTSASLSDLKSWEEVVAVPDTGSRVRIAVSGTRLFCFSQSSDSARFLDSPDDTSLSSTTVSGGNINSRIEQLCGDGERVVCANGYGTLWGSTDNGTTFTKGAELFSPSSFYTFQCMMDCNAGRFVIGGRDGVSGGAFYSDDVGATATRCLFPDGVRDAQPQQVKYCGDSRWLMAFSDVGGSTDSGLYLSTDNAVSFRPVSLPESLFFSQEYGQSIAVSELSGDVVVCGTMVGSDEVRFYATRDFVAWEEISRTGTNSSGISEIYPLGGG